MLTFTSLLWIWKGEGQAGRWYFLTVPEEQAAAIKSEAMEIPRGFGSVKVEASIPSTGSGQAVVWRTSVFPLNAGGYLLPVKADIRKRAELSVGDEVTVTLRLNP